MVWPLHNKLLLSLLRGWDLRTGASHLHYGTKEKRYVDQLGYCYTKKARIQLRSA